MVMYMPWCVPVWVQFLWDSGLPGLPGSLFPLPDLGSSPSLFFQISFSISWSSSCPSGTPMIQILGHLKLSQRFLSLSSFFWILVSSFCSGWMFISSFWFESQFPSHIVGSLNILLYFTLCSLHLFLHFGTELSQFCEHPDYQCFELCLW